MQLGMIGLGRMGANMVRRLMAGGTQCVVYRRHAESRRRRWPRRGRVGGTPRSTTSSPNLRRRGPSG